VAASKNTEREAREARERLRRYNARQAVHTHQIKRRTRDNILGLVGLVVIATLATLTQIYYFSAGPGEKHAASASPTPTPTPTVAAGKNVGNVPPVSVAQARTWTGSITINHVKLGITLDGAKAPQAVASFVTDIKDSYLDGKYCSRLTNEKNFGVLQCGATSNAGADVSNYSFGPLENTPSSNVYPTGEIALARGTDNAFSQGHQFFITYETSDIPPDSAGGYSVFGTITSGLPQLMSSIIDKGIKDKKTDGQPKVLTKITAATIK
jgi:peptidyl-prolyl cis-trans isomerase B (cyclophilin B)